MPEKETILSVMKEKRIFYPPKQFSKKAHIKSLKEYKRIYEIHNLGLLDSEVGTLLIEIEQPTGKDFQKKGQINIAKLKESTKQSQSRQVTEDFKRIFYKREIKINAV